MHTHALCAIKISWGKLEFSRETYVVPTLEGEAGMQGQEGRAQGVEMFWARRMVGDFGEWK